MLKVKVEGEVVVRDGTRSDTKWYTEEFILDEKKMGCKASDTGILRAVIRKSLIADRLRKKVDGYKRVRTLSVVSVVDDATGKAEGGQIVELMAKCVAKGCVPENIEQYGSKDAKIEAMNRALERAEKPLKKAQGDLSVEDKGYMD